MPGQASLKNFLRRKFFKYRLPEKPNMNKWFEILLGLILLIAAVVGWVIFPTLGAAALVVLEGGLVWLVILLGLLFLMLGISDLKE